MINALTNAQKLINKKFADVITCQVGSEILNISVSAFELATTSDLIIHELAHLIKSNNTTDEDIERLIDSYTAITNMANEVKSKADSLLREQRLIEIRYNRDFKMTNDYDLTQNLNAMCETSSKYRNIVLGELPPLREKLYKLVGYYVENCAKALPIFNNLGIMLPCDNLDPEVTLSNEYDVTE